MTHKKTPRENPVRKFTRRLSSNLSSNLEVSDFESRGSFVLPSRSIRQSHQENKTEQEMVIQAICYVAAITYTFGFSARISEQLTGSVAFPLLVIARITNPLQGALNILIYTRLHVSRLRTNQNISWRRAFWRVISSGADHDSASSLRGNSASNERNRGQSFRRLVQSSFSKSNNSDTLNSKQKEQHEAIKIDEAVDDIENIACGEMINDDEKIDESEKVLTLSNDSHLRRKDCSNNGFDIK